MPKMKTNRGAAKRFKATGTGKIRRSKAFTSHIMTSKSTKRKRNLRQSGLIDAADTKAVRRMLPYL
ncbi:MAG: 50S ribosomal protein L35 [Candidatus Electrothrix sp. AX5]|uniref:Large ribosomal subunit protein bL35 n=1 Tax=Candidatus Electrothrix aarhusensis TaxID=1859131 RepID=A0A3S3U632_9BACT|nr:50S ribosomal protein L35 [Candidatus Electrothrix sp. AX5]RWX44560.1 LSU ribosomal protein L35P [Candidatus Electrothrix aarhusensis]